MKCMSPEKAFLGLETEDAVSYEEAKAVVIPFGLEASVTYGGGTSKGPAAMIAASHEVELFDETIWREPYRDIGIVTLEAFDIQKPLEKAIEQLDHVVTQVLCDKKFPMIFGGEHSLTAGSIRAVAREYPDLVILHFDAHADLRDGYHGEHYSHASALRRCLDDERLACVSVGIRNISAEELPFLESNKDRIHVYWAHQKTHWDLEALLSHFRDKSIYLTFDVDGFDASLMPSTGTPEPGGLFWNETINIIQAVSQVGNIVAADVNELSPIQNLHGPDFIAAKLAYKILTYAFFRDGM